MPTEASRRLKSVWRVLATPPLGPYLAGRFLAMSGSWVMRVAVGWTVWEMTRSPAMVGIATLCMLGPEMLLAPISGALADRHDRRRMLSLAHLCSGALKVLCGALMALGLLPIWGLLALVAVIASVSGVAQAAAKAIISSMVEEHDLATAISLNSVLFNLAGFIGPMLAGGLIVTVGAAGAFIAAGLLSFAFVVALARVPRFGQPGARGTSMLADIRDGAAYVWNDPFIRPLCLLHMASATLARPFMEFIPALSATLFAGGAGMVAALTSAVGLGSICGGMWLAQRDNSAGVMGVVLAAFAALSAVLIAFVWTRVAALGLGLAMLAGFGMIVRAAGLQTLMQSVSDASLRGRVMSVYSLILNGGSIFGALLVGLLAERIGLPLSFTLSTLLALGIWAALRPRLQLAAAAHRAAHPHSPV